MVRLVKIKTASSVQFPISVRSVNRDTYWKTTVASNVTIQTVWLATRSTPAASSVRMVTELPPLHARSVKILLVGDVTENITFVTSVNLHMSCEMANVLMKNYDL